MLFDFVAQRWMRSAQDNYFSSADSFPPETAAEFLVILPLHQMKTCSLEK